MNQIKNSRSWLKWVYKVCDKIKDKKLNLLFSILLTNFFLLINYFESDLYLVSSSGNE